MKVQMFTDGSSRGNPGPGGFGTILVWGPHRKEISQGYTRTTNNRMELLAVIVGLETLKKDGIQVDIYSDSKYVVDSVSKGWIWNWQKKGFKGKQNIDLWKRFIQIYNKHKVTFHWVKGHAGHPENERCDDMAVESALSNDLIADVGYEG